MGRTLRRGVIVTAPGRDEVEYVVRFFAPSVGIDEDPVTGSITCTLAPYWSARLGRQVLHARQVSNRGGYMRVELRVTRVQITGRAYLYLQGTLRKGPRCFKMNCGHEHVRLIAR